MYSVGNNFTQSVKIRDNQVQDSIFSQRLTGLLKEYHKAYKNYDVYEIFLAAGVIVVDSDWDTDAIVKMGRRIEQSLQAQGEAYKVWNFGSDYCYRLGWYLIARSEDDAEQQLRACIQEIQKFINGDR